MLDLFEQETEDMIDAIEESRMELRGTMLDFEDETEQLRAQSRMLDKKGRKSQASRAQSRISYVNEKSDNNRQAVLNYIRQKEKTRSDSRSSSSLSFPPTPHPERPISVISSRSLPTPVMSKTILEKETDAIMKNLNTAGLRQESERQRQAEIMEQKRKKRQEAMRTREEKALELLERALEMDKQ
ncbi:hypothetical protein KUTeg_016524 [Tegillarca granosa]|uniref:Uncharacterized protein n=1 Tax=Tegillarca granosa TaxID=220873 RepID=A0ABQ9EL62_TEGGR|nr:hypothetical protein KUTeg_016524 [Tegillarca granosa]